MYIFYEEHSDEREVVRSELIIGTIWACMEDNECHVENLCFNLFLRNLRKKFIYFLFAVEHKFKCIQVNMYL